MTGNATRLPDWFRRLATTIATSVPTTHFATIRDHCAHCDTETPWAVHLMSGLYRCRRCGHSPFDESPDRR